MYQATKNTQETQIKEENISFFNLKNYFTKIQSI
jgi:hypothetical protein